MTHFAILSPPLTSHVRALEALAQELLARGHRVTWIAQHDVRALLHDERIGFATVGHDSHPPGALAPLLARAARPSVPLGIRRVIADMALATDMLCRESPQVLQRLGVESVISDQMEAAGGVVAEALRLPWISVACALPVNREPRVPLPVMPWPYAQDESALMRNRVSAAIYDKLMAPHTRVIEHHAMRLGLARRASLEDCLSPLLQLSQTTAGFDFPRQGLPAHFHHVGPLRPALQDEPAFDWPVAPGEPFVFASLGTMQGGRLSLFRKIARACRHAGAQLLVAHCGGLRADQAREVEHAGARWVTDFAPQRAALARANAVVTHAGLNTVMDALAAGTPMLALPIAFDQPGTAARVRAAGAGIVLSPTWARTASLQRALEALLAERAYADRARALGTEVCAAGGVHRASDLIEAALASRAKPARAEPSTAHPCVHPSHAA